MKPKMMVIILFILIGCFGSAFAQDGFQLYYKAKKMVHKRDYESALKSFELLKMKYPEGKYRDDAEFWSGYILERQKKYSQSFKVFEDFKKRFPKSPWVDDAEIQQVSIAEKMANRGQRQYVDYLVKKLNSSDKTIKYQASVSLANLRDNRALPALKQMAKNGDKDMSRMAKSLIRKIETKKPDPPPGSRLVKPPVSRQKGNEIQKGNIKQVPGKKSRNGSGSIKRSTRPKTQRPSPRKSPSKPSKEGSSSGKKKS